MKSKIKTLIALTFVLCLMACSSDDDSSGSNADLEGTWSVISLSIETAFDFNNDGTASQNLFEETECYNNDFVSFDNDGGVRVVTALTDISVNVISPTDYSYNYECLTGFDLESTWTQTGSTVTIQLMGYTLVGTISGNQMSVVIPDFFQIQKYDGTSYYNVTEDVTVVYKKE